MPSIEISMKSELVSAMFNNPIDTNWGIAWSNDMKRSPPAEFASGWSFSDSWIINTFPKETQFSPKLPSLPPSPWPYPPQSVLGLPSEGSPLMSAVSKILPLPSGVNPLEVAKTVTEIPCSSNHSFIT